jgi:intraflagellar transport protein 56
LNVNSDFSVALNLKSCAYFRLYDPNIAESQLWQIKKFGSSSFTFVDQLIQHNLCVFKDGFSVFPTMVDVFEDPHFNLAILYLRRGNPLEALNLLQDYQSFDITQIILKAAVSLEASDMNLVENAIQMYTDVASMSDVLIQLLAVKF